MRRKALIIIKLVCSVVLLAQNFESPGTGVGDGLEGKPSKSNLNYFLPATPNSDNLMRFEEIPVDYYTGVPDITIPLVNIPMINNGGNFDMSLKYHPDNTKIRDYAGYTGLGWSLFAGGVISRTVRGLVDESYSILPHHIGIHNVCNVNAGIGCNDTSKILDLFPGHHQSPVIEHLANDFLFRSTYKGEIDTQYDLYQYNFMGQTGRFIIKKSLDGIYNVEKLDINNHIITSVHDQRGAPISFSIKNDEGFQYIFDVIENSTTLLMGTTYPYLYPGFPSPLVNYSETHPSSFYLSKVLKNEVEIAHLYYKQPEKEVVYLKNNKIERSPNSLNMADILTDSDKKNMNPYLPSLMEVTTFRTTVKTKLLSNIDIYNKGKITLDYESDIRNENSGELNPINFKLKNIKVYSASNQFIEEFNFDYGVFSSNLVNFGNVSKMKLNAIRSSKNRNYSFQYNEYSFSLDSDLWDFAKCINNDCDNAFLIKRITYPTQGYSVFNFGSNKYKYFLNSYDGNIESDGNEHNGAGKRINSIAYYDGPSSIAKEVFYHYSDGALNMPLPSYSYQWDFNNNIVYLCTTTENGNNPIAGAGLHLNVFGSGSIVSSSPFNRGIKTRGGEIGYKSVNVNEASKGSTIYTYYNSIDFPDENYGVLSQEPHFFPVIYENDYKRGLLIKKEIRDKSNNLITEVANKYDFKYNDIKTGVFTYYDKERGAPYTNFVYGGVYSFYNDLLGYDVQNKCYMGATSFFRDIGSIHGFTKMEVNYDRAGKSFLKESKTKEFLKGGNVIEKNTFYTYNDRDYLVKTIQDDSNGQIETNYQYAHDKVNQRLINANMIGIPLETETKLNNKVVSKVETKYDSPSLLLPTSVLSFDLASQGMFTEVTYDQYDSKGNLLQYTTRGGISTAIVWGYNNTQPIAKIEGATYAQLQEISAIVDASNLDAVQAAGSDEFALLSALDAFRKNPLMKDYQITTYTYDPLIGVRSITPPSGIREYYNYDSANRLKEVRDVNGKILKEYKYNYKQ